MKNLLAVFAVLLLTAGMVSAFDTTAFQLSIWAPKMQLVPPEIAISGLKLNLPYGSNGQINGVDLGFVSISKDQNAELAAQVTALQINLWNSTSGNFGGIQVGLANIADNSDGVVVGLVNIARDHANGVRVGLVNTSFEYHGLEIALVNYTEFLQGVQIGLVNIATKSTLPFFPIVNMCF
ncbi:MAG: hypothetical protein IKR13_04770 [Victivallales bacterium]|nr:hypothetical protein [Victivallales bacterium]